MDNDERDPRDWPETPEETPGEEPGWGVPTPDVEATEPVGQDAASDLPDETADASPAEIESWPSHDAGPVGFDDDVRVRDQRAHPRPFRLVLEVGHHAALAPVERLEVEAVCSHLAWRHVPADIAAGLGVFDTDDVGAQVSQVQRAERAGAELFDCQYAKAF